MIPTRVSSPGKLILIGEHAAVYGRPAIVAALGARLEARFHVSDHQGVELVLHDIDERVRVGTDELADYTTRARRRWQEFDASPTPEAFRRLRGDDPAHLAKVAVGEALAFAAADDVGMRVEVFSQLRVGSGFGSSAALAAALVVGTLGAVGAHADGGQLESLVTEAERRQHGHPSGIDAAVVLRGGIQWIEYGNGSLSADALPAGALLGCLRVADTGTPEVPTGEVVAAVRRRSVEHPARFESALGRIAAAARGFRDALREADGDLLAHSISEAERGLEDLGVVPEPVAELVRRIEAAGGAAKISGAGASRGDRAGGLVVYHRRPEEVAEWDFLPPASWVEASLGAPPVRRETSS